MSIDVAAQWVVWVSAWLSVSLLTHRLFPSVPLLPGPLMWLWSRMRSSDLTRGDKPEYDESDAD